MGCATSKEEGLSGASEPGGAVPKLITRSALRKSKFILVYFFVPGDPTRQRILAALTDLAGKHRNIIFMEANKIINEEAVTELGVLTFPAFVAFHERTEVGRYEGSEVAEVVKLVDKLDEHIRDNLFPEMGNL